jgi:hypothetical protein
VFSTDSSLVAPRTPVAVALRASGYDVVGDVVIQRAEPIAEIAHRIAVRARVKAILGRIGNSLWMSRWDYLAHRYDFRPANLSPSYWLSDDQVATASAIAQSLAESRRFRWLICSVDPGISLFDLFALFARSFSGITRVKPKPPLAPRVLLKRVLVALRCAFVTLVGFFGAGKVCARNNP